MRTSLAVFLGVSLLCLASGCGGGSNRVERPTNPAPVSKDAKLSSAGRSAGKAAPAPSAPSGMTGQKQH